jgi:hypothetical protein
MVIPGQALSPNEILEGQDFCQSVNFLPCGTIDPSEIEIEIGIVAEALAVLRFR